MPHEDYVPAPQGTDYDFDPVTLYDTLPRPSSFNPPAPPPPLSPRRIKTALAFALGGVVFLLVGERRLSRAEATRGWIETSAVISTAKLRATGADYHLDLAYRYRAGPREQQGARIAFEPVLTRDAAYAYAERFRPGATVPAWFDPAAPQSAVLEQPNVAAPWAPSAFGAALLVGAAALLAPGLFRHLRYRRELRRAAELI